MGSLTVPPKAARKPRDQWEIAPFDLQDPFADPIPFRSPLSLGDAQRHPDDNFEEGAENVIALHKVPRTEDVAFWYLECGRHVAEIPGDGAKRILRAWEKVAAL